MVFKHGRPLVRCTVESDPWVRQQGNGACKTNMCQSVDNKAIKTVSLITLCKLMSLKLGFCSDRCFFDANGQWTASGSGPQSQPPKTMHPLLVALATFAICGGHFLRTESCFSDFSLTEQIGRLQNKAARSSLGSPTVRRRTKAVLEYFHPDHSLELSAV